MERCFITKGKVGCCVHTCCSCSTNCLKSLTTQTQPKIRKPLSANICTITHTSLSSCSHTCTANLTFSRHYQTCECDMNVWTQMSKVVAKDFILLAKVYVLSEWANVWTEEVIVRRIHTHKCTLIDILSRINGRLLSKAVYRSGPSDCCSFRLMALKSLGYIAADLKFRHKFICLQFYVWFSSLKHIVMRNHTASTLFSSMEFRLIRHSSWDKTLFLLCIFFNDRVRNIHVYCVCGSVSVAVAFNFPDLPSFPFICFVLLLAFLYRERRWTRNSFCILRSFLGN